MSKSISIESDAFLMGRHEKTTANSKERISLRIHGKPAPYIPSEHDRAEINKNLVIKDIIQRALGNRGKGLPPVVVNTQTVAKPTTYNPNDAFYGRPLNEEDTGKIAAIRLTKDAEGNSSYVAMTPLKDIKNSRPAVLSTPQRNSVEPPEYLETPDTKTRLTERQDFGGLVTYRKPANDEPQKGQKRKRETDETSDEELEQKNCSATLTKKDLQKVDQWRAKHGKSRGKSQKNVMGNRTAQEAFAEINMADNSKKEWLHLFAFRFKGPDGQTAENLVAGTRDANTAMWLIAEDHVEALLRKGHTVKLDIAVSVYKGTNVAKKIEYKITAKGREPILFSFDTKTTIRPSVIDNKYAAKLFSGQYNLKSSQESTEEPFQRSSQTSDDENDRPRKKQRFLETELDRRSNSKERSQDSSQSSSQTFDNDNEPCRKKGRFEQAELDSRKKQLFTTKLTRQRSHSDSMDIS
jgi:hypothetical protein